MASIRDIKKDVDFLVGEVISDSFLCLQINTGKKKDEIIDIINQITDKRNELLSKIGKAPRNNKKETKAYFKAIYNELIEKADNSFEKLSKLIDKK